jgi:hypothetical protein
MVLHSFGAHGSTPRVHNTSFFSFVFFIALFL